MNTISCGISTIRRICFLTATIRSSKNLGPEFFGRIGRKGGKAVSEKYGPGHFERIGRKGGQRVADLIERAKSLESAEQAS